MRVLTLGLVVFAVGCGKAAVTEPEEDRKGPWDRRKEESARREQHTANLKALGEAMHRYAETRQHQLPPHAVYAADNVTPLLSWRVLLLPYLGDEEARLFGRFKLDEPWDGPTNKPLLEKMPAVYAPPGGKAEPYQTCYQVFVLPEGKPFGRGNPIFRGRMSQGLATIPDGSSNTILVVEAAKTAPWTKPDDLPFDGDQPLPALGAPEADVFQACFADGSVHVIRKDARAANLRAFITSDGAEVVGLDSLEKREAPVKTGSLTGKVLFRGQPVGDGWVKVSDKDGREAWGKIDADGNYRIADAPAGPLTVTVGEWLTFGPPQRPRLPPRYRQPMTSGITRTVGAKENVVFNIELQ
jgi:hypothetical protein